MKKIYIQVWCEGAQVWDDVKPTFHEVSNPAEFAQEISDVQQKKVRMTYHLDHASNDVGRLNGSYFVPKGLVRTEATNVNKLKL